MIHILNYLYWLGDILSFIIFALTLIFTFFRGAREYIIQHMRNISSKQTMIEIGKIADKSNHNLQLITEMKNEKDREINKEQLNQEKWLFEKKYAKDSTVKDVKFVMENIYKIITSEKELRRNDRRSEELARKIKMTVFLYGGERAIHFYSLIMMRENDKQSNRLHNSNQEEVDFDNIYLWSSVLSEIRRDFTGEYIEPMKLLQIHITDFKKHEVQLEKMKLRYSFEEGVSG